MDLSAQREGEERRQFTSKKKHHSRLSLSKLPGKSLLCGRPTDRARRAHDNDRRRHHSVLATLTMSRNVRLTAFNDDHLS